MGGKISFRDLSTSLKVFVVLGWIVISVYLLAFLISFIIGFLEGMTSGL